MTDAKTTAKAKHDDSVQASAAYPSTVRVTTFAIYKKPLKAGGAVEVLHGAMVAPVGDDRIVNLLAGSVPFHSDQFKAKAPKETCGLLMLYGVRDSLDELHYWRTLARKLGAEFASAELEFEIGHIEPGLTDRALLKSTAGGKTRFLNFRRMKASLQAEVLDRFTAYSMSDGTGIDEELNRVSQIATRPDLFDRLLKEDPDLSKLDILVIPVADDLALPGRMRQLAYVKPGATLVSELHSNSEVRIELPNWMNIKKATNLSRG